MSLGLGFGGDFPWVVGFGDLGSSLVDDLVRVETGAVFPALVLGDATFAGLFFFSVDGGVGTNSRSRCFFSGGYCRAF